MGLLEKRGTVMPPIVRAVYFSPTHTTKTIAEEVANALAAALAASVEVVDLTLPEHRPTDVSCEAGDVLVFGFPVYAGRVPALLLDKIARFSGDGTPAVVVGLYGNRDYDDALLEAADLLTDHSFNVVAAGAFIGEHSMTARVAAGRPDGNDLAAAAQLGRDAAAKIAAGAFDAPAIKGNRPYKDRPAPADIRRLTTDDCTSCGICVERCPMGIIDAVDPAIVGPGCIRCNACVKACPDQAKFFNDEATNKVVAMLESAYLERKEPELFL